MASALKPLAGLAWNARLAVCDHSLTVSHPSLLSRRPCAGASNATIAGWASQLDKNMKYRADQVRLKTRQSVGEMQRTQSNRRCWVNAQ